MAIDASIPLAGNYPAPTQPQQMDLASILSAGLQIKQQQQQMQKANSLKAILSQAGAVDPKTGKVVGNALQSLWSVDPEFAQKAISSNAQIDEREEQAAKFKSESNLSDMKRNAQAIRDGLAVYRTAVSEPGNDPGVAKDIMLDGLRDHLKGLGYSPEKETAIWGKISTMTPAQLETLATSWSTAADSAQTEAARDKRTLVDVDGQTLAVGGEADPTTGALPVTDLGGHHVDVNGAHIEKIGTAEDATRAAQGQERLAQGQEGLDIRKKHEASEETKRQPYQMGDQTVFIDTHGNVFDEKGRPTEITGKLSKVGSNTARSGTALAMQKFMEANPDATPEEIAHFSAGYTAAVRQAGAIGTRRGQVEFSEAELENAAKLSHDAYVKLPRGQFLPFNELTKKIETATSSPEQAAAYAADNTVVNTYARMVSPTGVGTDSDKQHAREMLNTAQSQEAHQAVIDQLMAEGKASRAGAQTALDESAGEPVVSATTPRGKAPPPPPAPPKGERPPYPGARLSPRDNQWYVQKDGKWFRVD